jgi:thiol-disulfide isomerase/thioredoxin
MHPFGRVSFIAVMLGVGGWTASLSASDRDRSADQILEELDAIKLPSYNAGKKDDQTYTRQFLTELQRTTETRAALILELYKADPDHDGIPTLMAERWSIRPFSLASDKLLAEIDDVLAQTQNQKVKIEGSFASTYARLYDSRPEHPIGLLVVEEYLNLAPKDPRGATLLQLAARRTRDEKAKTALEDRVLRDFPESLYARRIENIRQGIGKPFQLEFIDAISGSAVSVQKLKGKVVVIDFWATWCGPCVAEMPAMKALYARYHAQGVEFLGVSLDLPEAQGGLDRLKAFVKEKEIPWPQ